MLLIAAACGGASGSSTASTTASSATPTTAANGTSTTTTASTLATEVELVQAVQAAQTIQSVPANLQPGLTSTNYSSFPGEKYGPTQCTGTPMNIPGIEKGASGDCIYGDPAAKNLVVVYGDSHAGMWAQAVQVIAKEAGWKMELFALPGCPAPNLSFISYQTHAPNTACDQFHAQAPLAIKALHPAMVVVTSESNQQVALGVNATPEQWQSGLISTFNSLAQPGTSLVMIGDIPEWTTNTAECLAAHMNNVQACAGTPSKSLSPNLRAEMAASSASSVNYIATESFVCAAMCEPVINNMRVYLNQFHFTSTYTQYVTGALQAQLGITPVEASGPG